MVILSHGGLTACGPQRPLVVPTTPPSERNENPGLDSPPAKTPAPSSTPRPCSSAEDCFNSALQQMGDGHRSEAEAELRQLRDQYPGSPWAKRAGFLLGRGAADHGSPEADTLFSQARVDLPAIEEYSLFFTAEGQAEGGRFPAAVQTYDRLLREYPDSVLSGAASYQKAKVFIGSGNCESALTELNGFVTRFPKDPQASEAFLQIADCAVKLQDPGKAIWALQRVWFFYPGSSQAQEAEKALGQLSARGVSIPEPSSEARYERGRILFEIARYPEAAAEFRTLLTAAEVADRDEISLKLSEALIQMKQYKEARRLLEEVAGRTPRPDHWTAALLSLGRLAVREGEEERLVQIEKRLADRFPTRPERAKLLFWIGGFYEEKKQIEKAVQAYQRLIAEVPADPTAEDAVWKIGWIAYKTGRYGDVIKIFEDHLMQHPTSSLGGQFKYWVGRSAEQIGLSEEATRAYQEACRSSLRSFYCQRAGVRLARLNTPGRPPSPPPAPARPTGGGEAGPPAGEPLQTETMTLPPPSVSLSIGEANPALSRDRHYAMALELMALGLKPEAVLELTLLTERYAADRATALKMAELFYAAGHDHQSLRLTRLYFQDVLDRGGDDIPRRFWEQAYPNHVVEWMQRGNLTISVDPYLVAAVIREESAFDPKAISKSGALGLMQLMPFTAEWVAAQVGLKTFRQELLMDQATNIQLGAWYLHHLVQRFEGNVVLAVAGYNAGPEAVSRWAEEGVGDLDEFIESIPFNETRYFTKRVVRSYNEYLRIAGEAPAQRLSKVLILP